MAPRRSWAKANNPYWSNHVATWYAGRQDVEEYCQRRDLSPATLLLWAQHLVSPEDLRKRKERLQNLRGEAPKRQHKKEQSKRQRKPRRYRYGVRTDSGPIALQAFWGMHVEAMNFSGMGACEICPQRLASRRTRCASGAIAWNNPATKWTGEACFIRVPGRN